MKKITRNRCNCKPQPTVIVEDKGEDAPTSEVKSK